MAETKRTASARWRACSNIVVPVLAVLAVPSAAGAAPSAAVPSSSVLGCSGASQPSDRASLAALRGTVTCLLRAERNRAGLSTLRSDGRLGRAARGHNGRMVQQGFFAHVEPSGLALDGRLKAVRWIPRRGQWSAGEVLGEHAGGRSTPLVLVQAWMASSHHRAILRDPRYDRVGVAVARETPKGTPGLTATVDLGRR